MTDKQATESSESILAPSQPCKPRTNSTHTDALPMTYRPGALDAQQLPSIRLGWRIWPDGRKEKI